MLPMKGKLLNRGVWWWGLFIVLLAGCERAPLETESTAPTFSEIQSGIFTQSCALSGCHRGESAPKNLDLSEGAAYANLVKVPSEEVPALFRVDPENPDSSYLVIKLEGSPRMEGAQMPLGGVPLDEDQIEAVRQWIAEGAPEN